VIARLDKACAARGTQVTAALAAAQTHDANVAPSKGCDTVVGQRGVNLSGSQKQRISIARVMVAQPRVPILLTLPAPWMSNLRPRHKLNKRQSSCLSPDKGQKE
jgi:ABC-type protease/lipase transport system fused ATPase/permease subunit